MPPLPKPLLALFFLGLTASQKLTAQATTSVWSGASGSSWSTVGNWQGGVPADVTSGTRSTVQFDATATNPTNLLTTMDLTSGLDLGKITVIDPSGAVTIRAVNNSSRVIDLIGTGGATTIDMSAATQDLTFANNGSGVMTLNVASGDQTWNVKTGRTLTTSAVSGSTSFVVTLTGGGTVVIGGTSDNGNGRFATAAGSATVVFLAKNSSASVHALGGNAVSSIGAGTEMRITGTGGDQIFYQTDLLVDGKFDLNGKSEGLDALSSGSGVASGVITSAVAGAVTLRINEGGGGGTYGGIMEDGLGALTLVKASTGTQILAGASTYTGSTTVSRGILQLIGANGALANTSSIIIDGFGELRLDSRTASNGFGAAANLNRVNNAASISLRGGVLSLYGLTTAAVTEELGAVSIANGVSHIRLSSDSAAGANVTGLTVSDLSRSAGSQVVFFGENATGFGTVNSGANDVVYFRVTTGAISAAELSGAGGTGTDRDLYIGAFGSVSTSTTTGTEFMTLETVGGYDYLRPLTSGEYAVLTSGQIGEHVAQQSANTTLSANTAYNALKITAGNTLIGANKTLYLGGHAAGADANPTVTEGSGMLIANGNSNILGLRSALDFSGREAMIRVTTGTLNIESSITGTAGLSKLGNGALNLTGRNTFTGDVYVNEGILQVRNDLGLGGSGTVYVNGTAGTNLLQLTNGINVKGRDVVLGVSNGSATVGFKSNAGHNTWDGDVIVGNVGLGGNSSTPSYLQVSNNAALTIYGDVYGKEDAPVTDSTYQGNDGSYTRRVAFDGSGAGVVNLLGTVKDIATGATATRDDRLRFEMNAADLTLNVGKAMELAGFLYLRQGYMRYEGTGNFFSTSANGTDRTIMIEGSGTGSEVALMLTKDGQTFYRGTTATAALTIGNGNNTTVTNVVLGGENESGVVTFGDGTQRLDINPRTSDDASTANVADYFRDVRFYAAAGGEVNIRMEIMEDTGFGLTNEVGAITKVGRGTVRLSGKTGTNNDVDGGVYALGGTLLLDYGTINNVKVQSLDGAQFTTAGGDVRLIKSSAGTIAEKMTGNLTVRAGGSEVSVDTITGGNVTLALAGITAATVDRRTGGTLNFVTSGAGTSVISLTRGAAGPRSVRLGGWATFGTANNTATQWAYINGSGNVAGYAHTGGELNTFGTGLNTDLTLNASLSGETQSNSLRINDSAVTSVDLGGNTLTLTEGGVLIGSGHSAALTFANGSLASGNSQDFIVHNYGTGGTTISADIAGAVSFTHAGTGVTTLSGAKTFTGTVHLVGGVVSVNQDSNLGNSANALYLNGGALRTTADLTTARAITLGGDGGRFDVTTGTTTLSGVIASEGNFIYTETNASTGGIVNAANTNSVGVGDLIKTGSGMLVIDNSTSTTATTNTYRGLTDVREGTLRVFIPGNTAVGTFTALGSNDSWMDATVVRDGATLEFFRNGNTGIPSIEEWVRLENNSTLKVTGGRLGLIGVTEILGTATFNIATGAQLDLASSGYLSGTGDLVKTGGGSLVMLGNNALYTGAITIREGTLSARGQGQNTGSNFAAPIRIEGSGSYRRLSVNEFNNHWLVEDHDFVVNGTGGNRIAVGNDSTPTDTDIYDFNGDITLQSDLILASEMQISVVGGGLRVSYARFNGEFSGAKNLTTSMGTGTAADQRRGHFELNGVNTGWTGALTIGNATSDVNKMHVVRLGNTLAASASNNVTLRFNSTLQVGGNAVTIGNLTTTGETGAGSTEVIENASHVAGTLTITQTTHANWDAYFRDGTPAGTIYETEDADPAARLSLVKAGAGNATLTLDNSYTGGTTVDTGTLQVGGGGSKTTRAVGDTGTGATTSVLWVKSGATVAGTGTVQGVRDTVTPANTTTHVLQGTMRPGDLQGSAVTPGDLTNLGTLAVKGNLDARAGAFAFQVGGVNMAVDNAFAALEVGSGAYNTYINNNLGTWDGYASAGNRYDHDFLDIEGQLSMDGSTTFTVDFTTGYDPVAGTILDLMDWIGALGGSGFDVGQNFRSGGAGGGDLYLPTLANGSLYYDVSQFASNGIIMIVAPEPGRALLLVAGVLAMVMRRRRRRG